MAGSGWTSTNLRLHSLELSAKAEEQKTPAAQASTMSPEAKFIYLEIQEFLIFYLHKGEKT
jgi:hypothetical protein